MAVRYAAKVEVCETLLHVYFEYSIYNSSFSILSFFIYLFWIGQIAFEFDYNRRPNGDVIVWEKMTWKVSTALQLCFAWPLNSQHCGINIRVKWFLKQRRNWVKLFFSGHLESRNKKTCLLGNTIKPEAWYSAITWHTAK